MMSNAGIEAMVDELESRGVVFDEYYDDLVVNKEQLEEHEEYIIWENRRGILNLLERRRAMEEHERALSAQADAANRAYESQYQTGFFLTAEERRFIVSLASRIVDAG